jgi:hypothetical protein
MDMNKKAGCPPKSGEVFDLPKDSETFDPPKGGEIFDPPKRGEIFDPPKRGEIFDLTLAFEMSQLRCSLIFGMRIAPKEHNLCGKKVAQERLITTMTSILQRSKY